MFAFEKTVRTAWMSTVRMTAFACVASALVACTAMDRKHGWVPNEEELADVVPGLDTRDSVIESFGEPGTTGVTRTSGYYYISSLQRRYGTRAPKVVWRELVAITFDDNDVVTGVERYGLEDGRVIPLERRVTSSSLQDKTFLRQLLGNLGNVNPSTFLQQ